MVKLSYFYLEEGERKESFAVLDRLNNPSHMIKCFFDHARMELSDLLKFNLEYQKTTNQKKR